MVISEVVENEVVLVNFDSGSYYSLGGSGTQVWEALEGGAAPHEVVNAVLSAFDGPEAEISMAVRSFLEQLLEESLERFDDMRDMLLLDPIHEVDEAGWPHTKPPE